MSKRIDRQTDRRIICCFPILFPIWICKYQEREEEEEESCVSSNKLLIISR